MQIQQVGGMYATRTVWPELAQYNYRSGKHELTIFLNNPTHEEIQDVAMGDSAFALFADQGLIVLTYTFGNAIPWSDAPYSIHLLPESDRKLAVDGQSATMHVVLVDASTGIIKALRLVSMPSEFSMALHNSINQQAAQSFDPRAYDRHLEELYAKYSPADIQRRSLLMFANKAPR